MATVLITHPDCGRHEMGEGHPESPARLKAILAAIEASGLAASLSVLEAPEATREQLERVHDGAHVDMVFEAAPREGYAYLDPDTSMNPASLSAALRAAGAVVRATDLVMSGEARTAFCAVRPPGHHATPARPMGFCIFNNVAVGAMHAIEAHGLERVAILDFDVHHGNGTEDAFHENPRVMLCSTFQHPYYPYCGADSSNEHIVNVPLPAMTDGKGFRAEMRELATLGLCHRFRRVAECRLGNAVGGNAEQKCRLRGSAQRVDVAPDHLELVRAGDVDPGRVRGGGVAVERDLGVGHEVAVVAGGDRQSAGALQLREHGQDLLAPTGVHAAVGDELAVVAEQLRVGLEVLLVERPAVRGDQRADRLQVLEPLQPLLKITH